MPQSIQPSRNLTAILFFAVRIAAMGGCLLLPACMVGPDYRKPEADLPQEWTSASGNQKPADEAATEKVWWQNFHDPVLDQLITKAAAGNFDVQLAGARIAEARAALASSHASLFPTGDMMFYGNRQSNQIAFPNGVPSTITSALKNPFNYFKTGFDASWELDLFGGRRRDAASAKAELEAAAISGEDVLISTLAEVARIYVDVRLYQQQLKIAQETLDADINTANILNLTFAIGKTAGIDASRALAQQQHDQTQISYYNSLLAQAEYGMDVLLGEQPGVAHGLVSSVAAVPVSDSTLILEAPAVVIAQRPDIRYAERKLASATEQQGVAVAKFFPDISLTGFIGLFNTNAGNLLSVGSKSWNMGGNVLWPILSFGSLSANLHAADAKQQQALSNYQKSIISALSDVERAFSAYAKQEAYTGSLAAAVATDQDVYEMALGRYTAGLASYLDVLDAQRKFYVSRNLLVLAKAQTAQNLIAVYKSLGGGWKAE
ncbi:MAG: efflux transporter outer membrane subunit [Methylococcales bacterium]|nr:efflux transporter outer membrane subunit [Methylococcales bacterium]